MKVVQKAVKMVYSRVVHLVERLAELKVVQKVDTLVVKKVRN